jgi:hypothetical protein
MLSRLLSSIALALVLSLSTAAGRADAQYVTYTPVVSYYTAPAVSYYRAPVVSYYSAPVVSYYTAPAPVVSYYTAPAPVVSYYVAPAPVVSYYSAPAVVGVTTYRRAILPRNRVTTSYYYYP